MKTFIETIWDLAKTYHRGQTRRFSNLPYYTHLERVSYLTRLYGNYAEDSEYNLAAIFHDSIEDCVQVRKDILIEDLTKIYTQFEYTIPDVHAKMVVMWVEDLTHNYKYEEMDYGPLSIKLCDRIDNITDCIYYPTPVKLRHKYSIHGKDTPRLIAAARKKIPENPAIDVLENIMRVLN